MYKKQNIYWSCQISGWLFYTAINLFFFKLSYKTNALDVIIFLLWFPLGVSITHLYRLIISKLDILKSKIVFQLPFIILSTFLMENKMIELPNFCFLPVLFAIHRYFRILVLLFVLTLKNAF